MALNRFTQQIRWIIIIPVPRHFICIFHTIYSPPNSNCSPHYTLHEQLYALIFSIVLYIHIFTHKYRNTMRECFRIIMNCSFRRLRSLICYFINIVRSWNFYLFSLYFNQTLTFRNGYDIPCYSTYIYYIETYISKHIL